MAWDSTVLNTVHNSFFFFLFQRSPVSLRLIKMWTFLFVYFLFLKIESLGMKSKQDAFLFLFVFSLPRLRRFSRRRLRNELNSTYIWFLRFLQHKRSAGYCKELITYRKFLEKIQKTPQKKNTISKNPAGIFPVEFVDGDGCTSKARRQPRCDYNAYDSVHPDKNESILLTRPVFAVEYDDECVSGRTVRYNVYVIHLRQPSRV
jgi:hypothetical protein